jgi:hypothetical protein
MTISNENHRSREFTISGNGSAVLRYDIDNTYDEDEVVEEILRLAPVEFMGYVRQSAHATAENDAWSVDVTYGVGGSADMVGSVSVWRHEWHMRIGSQQAHRTHSLETTHKYVADGEPTDTHNAIGVSDEGKTLHIDGVDMDVSTFDWSETLYVPTSHFNASYVNNLFVQRGRVNSHAFRGPGGIAFEPGEVLCLDISAEPHGLKLVAVHFDFSASPNVTDLKIGGITNIAKKGWEYLWVWWKNIIAASTKDLAPSPKQVNIERVREDGSFLGFGLPARF